MGHVGNGKAAKIMRNLGFHRMATEEKYGRSRGLLILWRNDPNVFVQVVIHAITLTWWMISASHGDLQDYVGSRNGRRDT